MNRDSKVPGEIPGEIDFDDVCCFAEDNGLTEPTVSQHESGDYWSISCEGKNPHVEITIDPEACGEGKSLNNFFIRSDVYKLSTYDQLLRIKDKAESYEQMYVRLMTTGIKWHTIARNRDIAIDEIPDKDLFNKVRDKADTIGCRVHVATTTEKITGDRIETWLTHLNSIQDAFNNLLIKETSVANDSIE